MFNMNGPPGGNNITSDQSSYDLVYKDYIISSLLGTFNSDFSSCSFNLTNNNNQIYKAELISATVAFNGQIPNDIQNQTLILSIPKLNANTYNIADSDNGQFIGENQEGVFCQIPDNNTPLTPIGLTSNNIISLLIGAKIYDSTQYYNPPISKIHKIDVQWYGLTGGVLITDTSLSPANGTISSFYFTLRIHYFEKRNSASSFSYGLFNYAASGTVASMFKPQNQY